MDQYFDIYLIKGFAKKPNSTKRPEIDISKEVTTKQKRVRGRLRDGCSIFQPVVEIRWDVKPLKTQGGTDYPDPPYQQADIIAYNYAWIQLFGDYNTATYGDYFDNVHGRYYYITDITINTSGLYQLSLQVDVLATYRDEIGGSSQYIVRSGMGDYTKIDGALPISAVRYNTVTDGTNLFASGGMTVTVIAGGTTSSGLVYAMNGDAVGKITNVDNWVKKDEAAHPTSAEWESMDVLSAIKGQYVLPITEDSSISGEDALISLGGFDCGVVFSSIKKTTSLSATATVKVPDHPDAASFPFVECGSFCDYKIYVPRLGIIPISGDVVHGGDVINVNVIIDPLSATAAFTVSTTNALLSNSVVSVAGYSGFGGAIGSTGTATVTGSAARDKIIISGGTAIAGAGLAATFASGPVGVAGAALTAVAAAASMTQALNQNGVETAIASAQTTTHSISGGGGRFLYENRVQLMSSFIRINSGATVSGKPDCHIRKISESGVELITVAMPHIDLDANLAEIQAIYQYMERGFYYE